MASRVVFDSLCYFIARAPLRIWGQDAENHNWGTMTTHPKRERRCAAHTGFGLENVLQWRGSEELNNKGDRTMPDDEDQKGGGTGGMLGGLIDWFLGLI